MIKYKVIIKQKTNLARVMPVEVHDGLLQSQQVVDGADDDVHSRRVPSLGSEVVLPL